MHRLTKGRATRFEQGSRGIERDLAVDWTRTRACVMHAGIYGYLYINLKGPRSAGDRESRRDYERFARRAGPALAGRDGSPPRWPRVTPIYLHVHKTEELYGCSRDENPNLPDLMLAPHPGFAVVRKIRGRKPVRWCGIDRLEGTHRVEGILALGGPNVRAGARMDANIIDITPTTLAALGLRVPVDMEGRVIREAFSTEPIVETEPPVAKVREVAEEAYTDEDRRILQQRLSDLGYLE